MSVEPTCPWPRLERGLVAILRGLEPRDAAAVAQAVFETGIAAIEVPLNSPDPFVSIERIAAILPPTALVGAGTVLTAAQVDDLAQAGGRLLVSPNIDEAVMARAREHSMVTMPGVFTPTEAFRALGLGASALKFFPASVLGAQGVAAICAVLPKDAVCAAVGGISEADFDAFGRIGMRTFGLGSSLYRPAMTAAEVGRRAAAAVNAWDRVFSEPRGKTAPARQPRSIS